MLNISQRKFDKNNLDKTLRQMIDTFIENHKLSQSAHEEITAMTHSDKEIAIFFHEHEIEMTNTIVDLLIANGFKVTNLAEKVHIAIGLIDNLCHEIVYHKHDSMDYNVMVDLVIKMIMDLISFS